MRAAFRAVVEYAGAECAADSRRQTQPDAPAPKAADGHPDLSGVWMPNTKTLQDLAADMKPGEVPYQPWAEQLVKARANGARGIDDPAAHCVPGMPKLIVLPVSVQDLPVSRRDGHLV